MFFSDAFKLCYIHQRPFPQRVDSIGSWQTAMEVIGVDNEIIFDIKHNQLHVHPDQSDALAKNGLNCCIFLKVGLHPNLIENFTVLLLCGAHVMVLVLVS